MLEAFIAYWQVLPIHALNVSSHSPDHMAKEVIYSHATFMT